MAPTGLSQPCFVHGRVLLSPRVVDLAVKGRLDVLHYFRRHLHGDWGKVSLVYGVMNEVALRDRKHLLISNFPIDSVSMLTVVTKIDRGITTLLFPEEYELLRTDSTH